MIMENVFILGDSKFRIGADGLVPTHQKNCQPLKFVTEKPRTATSVLLSLSNGLSHDRNYNIHIAPRSLSRSDNEGGETLINCEP